MAYSGSSGMVAGLRFKFEMSAARSPVSAFRLRGTPRDVFSVVMDVMDTYGHNEFDVCNWDI